MFALLKKILLAKLNIVLNGFLLNLFFLQNIQMLQLQSQRDITWLSFNERVLQEAIDTNNSLYDRIRFLGIFSNNLDEFFRVRVATLNRLVALGNKYAKTDTEKYAKKILDRINAVVADQQKTFDQCFQSIVKELNKKKIFIKTNAQLNKVQRQFVHQYFQEEVRNQIVPLMIESISSLPLLKDKNLYLACILGNADSPLMQTYSLIEIPSDELGRFIILPSAAGQKNIILLEDVIRECLPMLFAQFGFNLFESSIIKVTRDAELDIDNDVSTDMIAKLEKGLKNRKKGKATRFIYEKNIDPKLLNYLTTLLHLTKKDNLIAGGKHHNFKDFMNFPTNLFAKRDKKEREKSFVHPLLVQPLRILKVLDQRDVLLHFPYHSFDSIIDLLREASIDPYVNAIKITCYRLAKNSKIINALINAVRNGKSVTVMLELRARFDEEANLRWKKKLEEEGVHVIVGKPNLKVHAKICLISKLEFGKVKQYGFVSTGNLNENTSRLYGDHCLLTSNKLVLNGIKNMFAYLENNRIDHLKQSLPLIASPIHTRNFFVDLIRKEIKLHQKKKPAKIIVKLNSLSDDKCIDALQDAINAGVSVQLIIRGIYCIPPQKKADLPNFKAISIVDSYLEHARVFVFGNNGNPLVYLSSADWMSRNLDHRVEATVQVQDPILQNELIDIVQLQLSENVKARLLDNANPNEYVQRAKNEKIMQSQVQISAYLKTQQY
jgi:polyphosphate kinase